MRNRLKFGRHGWILFHLFHIIPTCTLTPNSAVYRVDYDLEDAASRLSVFYDLEMIKFAYQVIPDQGLLNDLLTKIPTTPILVQEVIDAFEDKRAASRIRALSVLSKLGFIGLAE